MSKRFEREAPDLDGPLRRTCIQAFDRKFADLAVFQVEPHRRELERALRRVHRQAAHFGVSDAHALIEPWRSSRSSRALARASAERLRPLAASPAAPEFAVRDGLNPTSSIVMPSIRMFRPCSDRDDIRTGRDLPIGAVIPVVVGLLRIEDRSQARSISRSYEARLARLPVSFSVLPACCMLAVKTNPLDLHGGDLAVLDALHREARIGEVAAARRCGAEVDGPGNAGDRDRRRGDGGELLESEAVDFDRRTTKPVAAAGRRGRNSPSS